MTTFATRRRREKREAHRDDVGLFDREAQRRSSLDGVKLELLRYVRSLGVGATFQSVDFTSRLADQGHADLRIVGGLIRRLITAGVVEILEYAPNGGNRERNYHSTVRPVFRITSLDFSALGWHSPRGAR